MLEAFFFEVYLKSKVKSKRNCKKFDSNYWGNIRRNRYISFIVFSPRNNFKLRYCEAKSKRRYFGARLQRRKDAILRLFVFLPEITKRRSLWSLFRGEVENTKRRNFSIRRRPEIPKRSKIAIFRLRSEVTKFIVISWRKELKDDR